MRLLVIEDEPSLVISIRRLLESEGYGVDSATDGVVGAEMLESVQYDFLILDLMLPGMDGYSILRRVRRAGVQTPVLILTARDSIEDRVDGLNLGADDYMTKPFSIDELLARVHAVLRRTHRAEDKRLTAGNLVLDLMTHAVARGGRNIDLTAKEYAVLECLLRNKNRLLSREQIINNVWSYSFDYNSNIVDVYVSYLRKKIDEGHERPLISTVRGMGYMLSDR